MQQCYQVYYRAGIDRLVMHLVTKGSEEYLIQPSRYRYIFISTKRHLQVDIVSNWYFTHILCSYRSQLAQIIRQNLLVLEIKSCNLLVEEVLQQPLTSNYQKDLLYQLQSRRLIVCYCWIRSQNHLYVKPKGCVASFRTKVLSIGLSDEASCLGLAGLIRS